MEAYRKFGGLKTLFTLKNSPFTILFLLFVLLPLFFVPSSFISFEYGKAILISVGVILAFAMFLVDILKSGVISIPRRSSIFFATKLIVIVSLISALLSSVPRISLLGYGFEISTFANLVILTVLLYLASLFFQSSKRLFSVYASFVVISSLIAVFHIFRLFFGAGFLSFGYFPNIISNTIGKWNELAVFFGASLLLSLMALEMIKLRPKLRTTLWVSFVLSMIMLVVVNLSLVWYSVGAIAALFFVYLFLFDSTQRSSLNVVESESEETKMKTSGRTVSVKAIVVVVVAILFTFTPFGNGISQKISEKYNISNVEVRPSWSATSEIAQKTLKVNPIFGSGPNRFNTKWELYRPDVNLTNFWNLNFSSGIGYIPTTIIETGIAGFLAWLIFFVLFIFFGLKSLFVRSSERFTKFFTTSSFIVALYFWIMNIAYTPNMPILALGFFFTGLSIAAANIGVSEPRSFSIYKYKKLSFVAVALVVIVLVAGLWLGYTMMEKTTSSSYYSEASSLGTGTENINKTAGFLLNAINLAPTDVYYRAITQVNIVRLNNMIASASGKTSVSEETQKEFSNVLAGAVEASRRAAIWDPENYQNWLSVANVYETVTPVGIAAAADGARAAYAEASKRSPRNPGIYQSLARFEASQNSLPKAKEAVNKALALKGNYLEAIFLSSQIDAAQGNIQSAAKSTELLAANFPNDPTLFFRLGLLKYELKDYVGSTAAFEAAVSKVPVYANARYFLGLSYQKLGRNSDAITQFIELEKSNPESSEVKLILENLRAGNDPFAAAKKPIDNKPEKRKKLPIEETNN